MRAMLMDNRPPAAFLQEISTGNLDSVQVARIVFEESAREMRKGDETDCVFLVPMGFAVSKMQGLAAEWRKE